MYPVRGARLLSVQAGLMVGLVVLLALFDAWSFTLFFGGSYLGFLLLVELTPPASSERERRLLQAVIGVATVIYAVLLVRRFLRII